MQQHPQHIGRDVSSKFLRCRFAWNEASEASVLSESLLERSWRDNVKRGIRWADSLANFDKQSQRFAIAPADFAFPKTVRYEGWCGNFCRLSNDMHYTAFVSRIKQSFVSLVSACGPISDAAKEPILLCCSIVGSDKIERDTYAWLLAPAAVSGPHQARQVFALCQIIVVAEEDSIVLDLQSLPYIPSSVPFASHSLPVGPLQHMNQDEFAVHIVCSCGDALDVQPEEVRIERLAFENITLSRVKVIGIWGSFLPICIKMNEETVVPCEPGVNKLPPPKKSKVKHSSAVDLLDLVCVDACKDSKKNSCKSSTAIPKSSAKIRKAIVEEFLAEQCSENEIVDTSSFFPAEDLLLPKENQSRALIKAVGDASVAETLDHQAAKSLLEAVGACQEQHSSKVEIECDFDESDEEVSAEISTFTDADKDTATSVSVNDSDIPGSDQQQNQMRQRSDVLDLLTSSQQEASAGASASSTSLPTPTVPSIVNTTLKQLPDGSSLVLRAYKNFRHGNVLYDVRLFQPSKSVGALVGKISLLSNSKSATYKALCSQHKECHCIIGANSDTETRVDQLVEWLCLGVGSTAMDHNNLSKELRTKLGIKVRS